jgi:hypothetical protein
MNEFVQDILARLITQLIIECVKWLRERFKRQK